MGCCRPFIKFIQLILRIFIKPLVILCFKIYYHKSNKTKQIPTVDDPLLLLPAHQLAHKIRNKQITSTHAVQTYIKRINQIQPLLNCVVKTCFEEALQEAHYIDEILSLETIPDRYSETNAPLLGVPFSCKECLYARGMPNATGLISRKDFRCMEDSDVVKNMREAGAILLCQTNTSELCIWIESRNQLHGVTKNPYNLSRIVGGSSGGEACLISSAGSVIGIGSDIGGSIRIPCCLNGIYGHKSSYGLISNQKHYPVLEGQYVYKMLSTGPICRYASDLRLLFKVQAGPTLYTKVAEKFAKKVDLKQLNYFAITEFKDCLHTTKISISCQNAMEKAINFLETTLSVKVKKINLNDIKSCYYIWSSLMRNGNKKVKTFSDLIAKSSGKEYRPFRELIKLIFGKSDHTLHAVIYTIFERVSIPEPLNHIELGDKLKDELGQILKENSVLLSPGFPTVAPYHNQPALTNTYDFIYFGIYNALGFPVTQCPMGLCQDTGLPVGIQIVSNVDCDHLTISLAEHFEEHLIGWVPPF